MYSREVKYVCKMHCKAMNESCRYICALSSYSERLSHRLKAKNLKAESFRTTEAPFIVNQEALHKRITVCEYGCLHCAGCEKGKPIKRPEL